MRMWGTSLEKMCDQHMLGEHRELHMMVGMLRAMREHRVACDNCLWTGLIDDTGDKPFFMSGRIVHTTRPCCPRCGNETRHVRQPHIHGHLEAKLIDLRVLKSRHDEIVLDMRRRGMISGIIHDTPITSEDQALALEVREEHGQQGELDLLANEATLRERCQKCKY